MCYFKINELTASWRFLTFKPSNLSEMLLFQAIIYSAIWVLFFNSGVKKTQQNKVKWKCINPGRMTHSNYPPLTSHLFVFGLTFCKISDFQFSWTPKYFIGCILFGWLETREVFSNPLHFPLLSFHFSHMGKKDQKKKQK